MIRREVNWWLSLSAHTDSGTLDCKLRCVDTNTNNSDKDDFIVGAKDLPVSIRLAIANFKALINEYCENEIRYCEFAVKEKNRQGYLNNEKT